MTVIDPTPMELKGMIQDSIDILQPTSEKDPIDPDFQALFPAKRPEEYEILKEDIRKRGVLDKLIGWKEEGVILDGHNRYHIHKELKIEKPLQIQWLSFPDKDAAKMWMVQHQIMRRNLNLFQRVEAALQFEKYYAAKAQANQEAGVPLNSGEGVEVDVELAKIAKTSPDTVRKVRRIKEKEKDIEIAKDIAALRNSDPRVSIHRVFVTCTCKKRGKSEPIKPSQGLGKRIMETFQHFTDLTKEFSRETDCTYIYDKVIELARGEKAKLKTAKKISKKAPKKSTKKSPKKVSKKSAKKARKEK